MAVRSITLTPYTLLCGGEESLSVSGGQFDLESLVGVVTTEVDLDSLDLSLQFAGLPGSCLPNVVERDGHHSQGVVTVDRENGGGKDVHESKTIPQTSFMAVKIVKSSPQNLTLICERGTHCSMEEATSLKPWREVSL